MSFMYGGVWEDGVLVLGNFRFVELFGILGCMGFGVLFMLSV